MTISGEVLRRHGIALSPQAFEALVRAVVERLPVVGAAPADGGELAPAEQATLAAGGFDLAPRRAGEPDPLAAGVADFAALLATSLTVGEASERLGVDGSRIRQRLAARSLYGVKLPDGWRLPSFQFDGDRSLPNLGEVLARLDPSLHPLTVVRLFEAPDVDLLLDERPVSPRDWLRAGGDPRAISDQATAP